ncbi:MAG TPA: hypothetical protein DDY14_16690 [Chromatiaceae bacterium]|nr:MAG: hypothetical protein N838_21605 [Thiohalocapsa sp. PB-PSB1]HBG96919.1 hypothetical protein [Chromatiaceae bacterium]HCS89323.1 hypothetical protein [Chromatiaceae bacterium]
MTLQYQSLHEDNWKSSKSSIPACEIRVFLQRETRRKTKGEPGSALLFWGVGRLANGAFVGKLAASGQRLVIAFSYISNEIKNRIKTFRLLIMS